MKSIDEKYFEMESVKQCFKAYFRFIFKVNL
jgi:hypothetical protein